MSEIKAGVWGAQKGGPGDPGSGHHGHVGRPGRQGGSLASIGGSWMGVQGEIPQGPDRTSARVDAMLVEGFPTAPDWAEVGGATRKEAKRQIVDELARRTGADPDEMHQFIKQWARSSNDDDMRSLAIQRDASREFQIPSSEFTEGKIKVRETAAERERAWLEERGRPFDASTNPELFPLQSEGNQSTWLRAMYDNTQGWLAENGFKPGDTIRLRRGVGLPASVAERMGVWKGRDVAIQGNALESWSVGRTVASDFARGATGVGIVFEMAVPIERLMGSVRTGFGCLIEGEFIVLGSSEPDVALVLEIYE